MKLRILASLTLAAAVTAPAPAQNSGDDYGSRTTEFCAARKPVQQQTTASRPKRPARKRPTRVQPPASAAVVSRPSQLGYTLFQRTASGRPLRVDSLKSFRVDDAVRFSIESSIDGYLYVFNSDNLNRNPMMIFPQVRLSEGQNFVRAHVPYDVPSRHEPNPNSQWLIFGGTGGVDRLFFVVSSDPLEGVPIEEELIAASGGKRDFYWEPDPNTWRWVVARASGDLLIARSKSYGQELTKSEDGALSRELRLAPEAPPPSVLCVNKRADDFIVTFVDLRFTQ